MCDSPQLILGAGYPAQVEDCGICLSCWKARDAAGRQRRLYWLDRKRGTVHV